MIIKNFAPESLANEINTNLCGNNFPWFYNDFISHDGKNKEFQFTHTFYKDGDIQSSFFELIKPILYFAEFHTNEKIKSVLRIKANLRTTTNIPDSMEGLHQDHSNKNYKSLLYYVNDSDGATDFYLNDKKTINKSILPTANTAIWFDSNIWHKSNPPIINKNRIVINFIIEI